MKQTITRLRALADWLETTELPEGCNAVVGQDVTLALFPHDALTQAEVVRLTAAYHRSGGLLHGVIDGGVPVRVFPYDRHETSAA